MADQIETDCKAWGFDESAYDVAKTYFKGAEEVPELRDIPRNLLSAGCIFAAYRKIQSPRSFREMESVSGIPKKDIGKTYKLLQKHLPIKGADEIPEASASGPPSYRKELGLFFRDTAPITLSFAFQNVTQAISIFICGRLGTFELSVASYGYMFFSATASMIALGGSTAFDTLASQAFTSSEAARKRGVIGILLQRSLIFITIFFFAVIAPVWWHSGPLFRHLGQEGQFSDATEVFLKYMLPAGLAQVVAECVKKFLQVLNHRGAVGCCIGIGAVVGAIANYVLVLKTSLGVNGAPVAHAIYHLATIVTMVVFIVSKKSTKTHWGGFSREAFMDPWPFIFLSLAGILTVATEFWCFESIALMAATLDTASVGAQSIVMTSDLIFATVPLGLSISASHRIGKSLGAGKGAFARFQARIPYLLALCVGVVEGIVLLSIRNIYGRFFSPDEDVVQTTAKVLPLLAVFQCLDISNGGAAGILRGAAKTHLAGASNVVGYYCVGLLLAWLYCFKLGLGLFGLWGGLITGSATLLCAQSAFVFTTNFEKVADKVLTKAVERTEDERAPLLGHTNEAIT